MEDWSGRLAGIDDDYLVGISNKGIVKRAYKDKEEIPAEISALGDEATVKIGAETVTVCLPLGESKCTCPSRSICRHVVQAILVLKESCPVGGKPAEEPSAQDASSAEPQAIQNQDQETNQDIPQESGNHGKGRSEEVWKEVKVYPFEKLKKVLGNRHFQVFVNQATAGIRPVIQDTSVITVQLPEPGITVKLLAPLEYSTCTCHKKELCRHKAAALLWCQLEAGIVTTEELLKEGMETSVYDMEQVREAARQMRDFLEELLATGLSRVSPDVLDYLERLAIMGHNAGLARFEGYFRALADSYDRYLKRKATFQTKDLMEQITRLYRQVNGLLLAKEVHEVAELAGEFRAEYLPVGNLDLIGIAVEQYKSQTGYEGETIYFLEETTSKWYTYTNAKPVFYEGAKRRAGRERGSFLQGPAPWELGISLEKLLKVRIHLMGAKCDGRNRISSSQETHGEITGDQELQASDIKGWYYRDFGLLFQKHIGKQSKGTELVFVQPDSCAKAEFSQTGQQLTLPLYDKAGHELMVEVTYAKEEASTIRYLERISEKKLPCFLGKVSLRDGRLRMYPVDLMEIEAEDGVGEAQGLRDGDETDLAGGKAFGGEDFLRQKAEEVSSGRQTKYQVVEDITEEIQSLLEDLYQSGFDTVHDSTLQEIQKAASLTAQYGMEYLSGLLSGIAEEITAARHQMKRGKTSMAELYADINEYLYHCRQKTAYDRGADYYGNEPLLLRGAEALEK